MGSPLDSSHHNGNKPRHTEINEKYGDVVAVGHRSGFMMIVRDTRAWCKVGPRKPVIGVK